MFFKNLKSKLAFITSRKTIPYCVICHKPCSLRQIGANGFPEKFVDRDMWLGHIKQIYFTNPANIKGKIRGLFFTFIPCSTCTMSTVD